MTASTLPGRRRGRGVPQARQAGLHAGRRDGRVLDSDLGGPAVRHPAGVLRGEVHQHALRAGRDDRRPGHPDGELGDGLHLPPAGAGPPALRDAAPSWASCPRPSAPPSWQARTRPPLGRGPTERPSRPGAVRSRSRRRSLRHADAARAIATGPAERRTGAAAQLHRADRGRSRAAPPTPRYASPAAPRCAPRAAATSARAAAPPAAAAEPSQRQPPRAEPGPAESEPGPAASLGRTRRMTR